MICGAPFCGHELRFDANVTPDGTHIRIVAPRSATTPRAVSIQELWICQAPACREWARLRCEELDGGYAWLAHMKQVVLTLYCPELPTHLRQPRAAACPRELGPEATTAIEHHTEAAASGSAA